MRAPWAGGTRNTCASIVALCVLAACAAPQHALSPYMHDFAPEELVALYEQAKEMFYHGYDNYMRHAFPHDELKPLSRSFTDSLGELGNLRLEGLSAKYSGVALSRIDALSTLAVLGNASEFSAAIAWVEKHVSFDVDVRVNVFEANIRLLGGLLSAHLLAADARTGPRLVPAGYSGGLLRLAEDLGRRLLPALEAGPAGLPLAWVNLRRGCVAGAETGETNTAAAGSLTLEFAVLSRLTGAPTPQSPAKPTCDTRFEAAALRALRALWALRTRRSLLGTALDARRAAWLDANGGVGASADSFYEYLLKAYVLLGEVEYWDMFAEAYTAALQHYKADAWYHAADIHSGAPTHLQFTSLQAFWPGMQVLAGDTRLAAETHAAFDAVRRAFRLLPERYLFTLGMLHPTEQYYPLRPEHLESTFLLHQATGDPAYIAAGAAFMEALAVHCRVEGGWASVRSVASMALEDHMHSFFLAETTKYLALLFNPTFINEGNYVLTTEGHPIPIAAVRSGPALHRAPSAPSSPSGALRRARPVRGSPRLDRSVPAWATHKSREAALGPVKPGAQPLLGHWGAPSFLDARVCPNFASVGTWNSRPAAVTLCHTLDRFGNHTCRRNSDCGVDASNCRRRACSEHFFCHTPKEPPR